MSVYTDAGDKTPATTEWSRFYSYKCRRCCEQCINDVQDLSAQAQLCIGCLRLSLSDPVRAPLVLDRMAQLPPELAESFVEDGDGDARDLDPRQADDILCGADPASERSERDSAPGRNARQRSDSEQPGPSPGIRSERSEVPSTAIGDAAERLAYRRGLDR